MVVFRAEYVELLLRRCSDPTRVERSDTRGFRFFVAIHSTFVRNRYGTKHRSQLDQVYSVKGR